MGIASIKPGAKSRVTEQELLRRAGVAKQQPPALAGPGPIVVPGERTGPQPVIRLVVPGNPVPWERTRPVNGHPNVFFTPKRTRAFKAKIQAAARIAGVSPLSGPVKMVATFFRDSAHRCDVDNLSKSVQDALNHVAFADDSQIVALVAVKLIDRENPRTEIVISEVA